MSRSWETNNKARWLLQSGAAVSIQHVEKQKQHTTCGYLFIYFYFFYFFFTHVKKKPERDTFI